MRRKELQQIIDDNQIIQYNTINQVRHKQKISNKRLPENGIIRAKAVQIEPKRRGRPRIHESKEDSLSLISNDQKTNEKQLNKLYSKVDRPRGRYPRIVDRSIQTEMSMKELERII